MINVLADNIKVKKQKGKKLPLYKQIRYQVHSMIESGGILPGQELPSISLIAETLNVNYRTVKSAFELLEKDGVLNCEPNKRPVVIQPSQKPSEISQDLCFAFIRMTGDEFFVSASAGIKRYADENDINCIFIDILNDHDRFIDALNHPGQSVSGLILAPYESPEYFKAISTALKDGTKMVFIDRVLPNLDISCVSADHFMGAYQAAQHLLKNHSRPVFYIGNTLEPSSCRDRVAGWTSAMHSFGYPGCSAYLIDVGYTDIEMVAENSASKDHEVEAIVNFFDSHNEDKYSILTSNDYIANAVYIAAERKGLKIGKDIFIAGFGDLPLASRLNQPLTTVCQNTEQVGYEAAEVLFETITGTMPKPVHRILPVDLVVRKSSENPKLAGK